MFYSEITELNHVYHQVKEGNLREALHLVKELENNDYLTPEVTLFCKMAKADLFRLMGKFMESIEICEVLYPEFQQKGDLISLFDVLLLEAYSYMIMANVNKSESLVKRAKNLFNVIKDKYSIDLSGRESILLRIKSGNHYFKGEIQKCLDLNKKAYELAKKTGDKGLISASLGNISSAYIQMRKLNKALEYAKAAVELNYKNTLPNSLVTLIEVYVNRGEIKEAEKSLDIFRDYIEERDTANDKSRYIFSKALILKSSLRSRNRVKSEELFMSLAQDDSCLAEYRIDALINLCDLYISELEITNDLEILDEIQPFIQKLINIAQNQSLYLPLAETYLLQAKLSTLTSDIKRAQELFTQAQKLADLYGLERVAMKISSEHDKLLRQINIWKGETEISLSDRLDLASLKEQIEFMSRKRILEVPKQKDEDSILFLILTEGGNPIFSHWFVKENTLEDHLFGGFISTINAFIKEAFSERLDRASFGQYTLLMKSITPFLICYIFKGDSYYALQRVNLFIEKIVKKKEVWQTLESFYLSNRIVQNDDIPSLEPLLIKLFLEKSSF